MKTVLLLICSNIFMTIAWYGHLKFRDRPLFLVMMVSGTIPFADVLFSGAGEPDRLRGVHGLSTEGDSRGDYAQRICGLRVPLFGRAVEMELCGFVFMSLRGGGVCVLGTALGAR